MGYARFLYLCVRRGRQAQLGHLIAEFIGISHACRPRFGSDRAVSRRDLRRLSARELRFGGDRHGRRFGLWRPHRVSPPSEADAAGRCRPIDRRMAPRSGAGDSAGNGVTGHEPARAGRLCPFPEWEFSGRGGYVRAAYTNLSRRDNGWTLGTTLTYSVWQKLRTNPRLPAPCAELERAGSGLHP